MASLGNVRGVLGDVNDFFPISNVGVGEEKLEYLNLHHGADNHQKKQNGVVCVWCPVVGRSYLVVLSCCFAHLGGGGRGGGKREREGCEEEGASGMSSSRHWIWRRSLATPSVAVRTACPTAVAISGNPGQPAFQNC